MASFDIDIDLKPGIDRTLYGTRATIYDEDKEHIGVHPSGVYIESVPVDPVTGQAAFDYKNDYGFMKVDMLNNTAYEGFHSKEDILAAIESDIDWSDFYDPAIVETLPHIGKHYDLVSTVAPKSVIELADCLALIRPAKKNLLSKYMRNPQSVRRNSLYKRPSDPGLNYFKKSHAVSYAMMILVKLSRRHTRGGITWT